MEQQCTRALCSEVAQALLRSCMFEKFMRHANEEQPMNEAYGAHTHALSNLIARLEASRKAQF